MDQIQTIVLFIPFLFDETEFGDGGNMKQIITLSAILALTACSESRKSLEGEMTFADSVKTSNIVGGTPVSAEEDIRKTTVPIYQIHVQTDENNQIKSLGAGECTGSILANDIVLTAGHCTLTNPTLLFLYFGNDKPEVTGKSQD